MHNINSDVSVTCHWLGVSNKLVQTRTKNICTLAKKVLSALKNISMSLHYHCSLLQRFGVWWFLLDVWSQFCTYILFFFHLRTGSKIKSVLSFRDLEKVFHAFVSSHLDYYNAFWVEVPPLSLSLSCLQLVQNSAARLLMSIKKREHIAPVLINLHWLKYLFITEFITKCCYR